VIREGDVAEAVRASISLPGIFTPVLDESRVLIDGGMKNPVPVSTARDMGADVVIAVDVTGDFAGQAAASGIVPGPKLKTGIIEVVTIAFAMVMKELAVARNIIHPPDVLVTPKIGHIKQYAFDRGEELVAAGREATDAALPQIREAVGTAGGQEGPDARSLAG
jgi:NTE family protein